jgi:hypothetical protein
MTDEPSLNDMLHDPAWRITPGTDLTEGIKSGIRRRRRRRSAAISTSVLAVVGAAVAVPLALHASQSSSPTASVAGPPAATTSASPTSASPTSGTAVGAAVPWVALPVQGPKFSGDTSPATVAAVTSAVPCLASQLTMLPDEQREGRGIQTQWVGFRNTSATACTMPAVLALTPAAAGNTIPTWQLQLPTSVSPASIVLPPNGPAQLSLSGPLCDSKGPVVSSISVAVPSGGALTQTPTRILLGCGALTQSVLAAGEGGPDGAAAQNLPHPSDPPVATPALTARINAPQAAAKGKDLDYTVTLTNPTGKVISLQPCPDYTISLPLNDAMAQASYGLNCAAAPGSLAPQQSVTFAMKFAVPASASQGNAKFTWTMTDRSGGTMAVTTTTLGLT